MNEIILDVRCEVYTRSESRNLRDGFIIHPIIDEEELSISLPCFNHLKLLIANEVNAHGERMIPGFDVKFIFDEIAYRARIELI